ERFRPGPPERARFGLPESGPVVLMVSALIASKNVAQGIAAVAGVPDANLVVAGDGPMRNELQKLAGELLPGRYRQLTVPTADMPALYRSADAFMHLSTDESFGNVFVEAMASGLPIAAYDSSRTRWIVGDRAFFADPAKPESFTAAIGAALQAKSGEAATRERAQQFGWPAWPGPVKGTEVSFVDAISIALIASTRGVRIPASVKIAFSIFCFAVVISTFAAFQPMAALFYAWQLVRTALLLVAIARVY